jgi:hypothetical protein
MAEASVCQQRHPREAPHRFTVAGSPERYGPWQSSFNRVVRWRRDGTRARLVQYTRTSSDAVAGVLWEVRVERSTVRAHSHGAGASRHLAKPQQNKGRPTRSRSKDSGAGAAGWR